jgi:hypothetical protein
MTRSPSRKLPADSAAHLQEKQPLASWIRQFPRRIHSEICLAYSSAASGNSSAVAELVPWGPLEESLPFFAFTALWAQQPQGIFRIKRVLAHGLLSRGVEGDIHPPVIGQDDHLQVAFDSLPLLIA